MAVDMFIKIDGVKGESTDDKHKGDIDVLAWSWGLSQAGSGHTGGGAGAGKVHVQDISFTKYVDSSSAPLMNAIAGGTHYKKVDLAVRKAGGKAPVEYLKIHFEEVFITSLSTGGSGGEDRLTENVTLNFAKFKVEYTPQKADGTPDVAIFAGWDVKANKAL
jgi:type VI secretion system secreted protein Hcp